MSFSLYLKFPSLSYFSTFLFHQSHSQSTRFFNGGFSSSSTVYYSQIRQRPSPGKQIFLPNCSSLPLSRMLHSYPHRRFHSPHFQIPFILSFPSSFFVFQEKLLIFPINFRISLLPSYRGFSDLIKEDLDTNDDVYASESEGEEGHECGRDDSRADSVEVDRVCKVIDELFSLDRNMEAVLDECGLELSHDLVLDVLARFKQARKPAFRFFCWAAQKPGYAHNSKTYNMMMTILGKTRQFETMVSLLEEMGEKELLTMETFIICFKAFAAAKERKKAVGIFELMKKHKYKVGVDTINCLLDSLGRAKLGREAQTLFEKLNCRFTPNLQTYTVLLNGWCRVRNLMEAGKIWNQMIDDGFKPDIVAHNTMLEGLLRCKKRSDAIKLFEVMKAKGPFPDVKSYTILVRDFCKQIKMKEAVGYFDEMLEAGCQPDAGIYTCLITGFGNQKRMDMVYGLLKEMKAKGCPPDGKTYNALIKLMTCTHRAYILTMALVDTTINYFTPPKDGSKPYQWIDEIPGVPRRNWDAVDFNVKVENVRGREKEFTLDKSGFEFHHRPTPEKNFDNDESIRSVYYEDSIQVIKELTGASRVVIFDHTIRRPRPEGTPDTPENRGPVRQAHVDQTPESAKNRVKRHLPEADVPALLSKRYQIINLWRPIQVPAWQLPLALCDFQSVSDSSDFIPTTLKYKDRDGETLAVKYNDAHKWKYVAGLTPDEFVLIKCFDSKLDGSVASFTPHTAFEDPTTPADAPDRHSIEIRALVFYD